jgi:hypothetical protein
MAAPRGSRKHVLDWTGQPGFDGELIEMARPVACRLTPESIWQPRGHGAPEEARLEAFGPRALPAQSIWPELQDWWLKHKRGANTPNWDIALSCEVEGRPGLILVEAKANVPELAEVGKSFDEEAASERSRENHRQIGKAIAEARDALAPLLPGIRIDRDRHYQLSNRIAFAWRLASLGVPTVLVYLGFTGDRGIADAGEPLSSDEHWQATFAGHLAKVCPLDILGAPVDAGAARFWVLVRSRAALEQSPAPEPGADGRAAAI